ncbi:hypothetical protein M0813_17768 [Anaeramoeba flamelloides]|uniref:Uncharacterized protein n=1 Tax=Anaeramoeba flamelloides TaxID=1746091 RepID=A0ABQ8YU94_9EUKA|nr:hypothetical protein M0813_17768 [Anaeramoeba flamelloides]
MEKLENKEYFKKLQQEFQNIRRFKNRLQKLMEIIPGCVEGITIQQLEQNQISNSGNKRHSKRFFMSPEIKVKRSVIKYLSELTQLKKKSIERGLSIFFEKTYHLYNTREYSREWMIFRKEKPVIGKSKSRVEKKNKIKPRTNIKTTTKTKTTTNNNNNTKKRTKLNKQNIRKIKHKSLPTQNFSTLKRKKRVISDTQSHNDLPVFIKNKRNSSPKLQKTNSFNSLSDSFDLSSNKNLSINQNQSENESEIESVNGNENGNGNGDGDGSVNVNEEMIKIKTKRNFKYDKQIMKNKNQSSYYRHPKINKRPKSFSYYYPKYENQTTLLNQMIFPKDQSCENNFRIQGQQQSKNELQTQFKTKTENQIENEKGIIEKNDQNKFKRNLLGDNNNDNDNGNDNKKINNNNKININDLEKKKKNSKIYQRQLLKPFEPQTDLEDLYSSFHLLESDQMDEFQKRFYEITFNNSNTENHLMFDENIHWSTLGDIWKSDSNSFFY